MSATQPLTAELGRLIERYGATLVRKELKHLAKGKAGRPEKGDYWLLRDAIEQDARNWLDGTDRAMARSNKRIATSIAEQHPEPTQAAIRRRIMRKLSRHRTTWMKVKAMWIAEDELPFIRFFEVASEVESLTDYTDAIVRLVDLNRGALERYRARFGEPEPAMTIRQIVEKSRQPAPVLAPQSFANLIFSRGVEISPE